MADNLKQKTLGGLFWSFLERAGTQFISFLVSLVLARILMPDDYGIIAIVLVFINICDVFVKGGMGSALVQKKNVDEKDFSTIFWISLLICLILYGILFVTAPMIARFYKTPILCDVIRVLGLRLPISSYNTVQRAIVSREMRFRVYFYASMVGVVLSAVVGIMMAYYNYGVWALVWQQIASAVFSSIVVAIFVRWYPKFVFSFKSFKALFAFGWKVLVAGLIDVLYEDFRSLYVGKLYTPADLAYYTRGKQFPALIVDNINTSIATVLFPVMSKKQDDVIAVKTMVRRSIKTSSFIIMPLMFGLAAIARPLVLLLLTEKWLPCVPFLQILCINYAIMPLQTANVQAIYAIGRSDIVLRLNIIKKSVGFVSILLFATISVKAMAWGGVFVGLFAFIVNASPNKKLINYSYLEQIKDLLPCIALSAVMFGVVYLMNFLPINSSIILMILQILIGGGVYYGLSYLFKLDSLEYILTIIGEFKKK